MKSTEILAESLENHAESIHAEFTEIQEHSSESLEIHGNLYTESTYKK